MEGTSCLPPFYLSMAIGHAETLLLVPAPPPPRAPFRPVHRRAHALTTYVGTDRTRLGNSLGGSAVLPKGHPPGLPPPEDEDEEEEEEDVLLKSCPPTPEVLGAGC